MDKGVHIWTRRAITPIPPGATAYDEEPDEDNDTLVGDE